jgi:hypothetical protein
MAAIKDPNSEIVKRSDQAKEYVVLPKRWIVERTFAWLNRCRRLAKDWENLNRKALAFLRLASLGLMLRSFVIPHEVIGQTLRPKRSLDTTSQWKQKRLLFVLWLCRRARLPLADQRSSQL